MTRDVKLGVSKRISPPCSLVIIQSTVGRFSNLPQAGHLSSSFISVTSKHVKFVENVLCGQKFNHILCCNTLIVCVCEIPIVINISYRSSSDVHSLTVSMLICSFMHFGQTQEIPGAAHFILGLSSGIVCHFLSATLGLSSVKPQLKVHFFSIYFKLCIDPNPLVCVWTNVMWESF